MTLDRAPPLVRAGLSRTPLQAALAYARLGLSVVPLVGKRPTVPWQPLQHTPASLAQLTDWDRHGRLHNVGLVCGAVSGHLVVLDVDAEAGYSAFRSAFPHLTATLTVRTGSGQGRHLYWQVEGLPPTLRVRTPLLGSLELLADGCQVVAPPSRHPVTHQPYRIENPLALLRLPDLHAVVDWLRQLPAPPPVARSLVPSRSSGSGHLNPRVVNALVAYFEQRGYRRRGTWLNGRCLFPHHHRHGDTHPSFGFQSVSGYGFCFVCGTILARDLCQVVGIDPAALGGLMT